MSASARCTPRAARAAPNRHSRRKRDGVEPAHAEAENAASAIALSGPTVKLETQTVNVAGRNSGISTSA